MRWETKKCIEAAFRDEHRRHGPLEAVHSHFRKGKEKKQQWRVNFNCPLGSNCCEGYAKDRVTKCWTAESTNSGVAATLSQAAYHRHKQCFEVEKLRPGEFIAVQDREDGNHTVPFMIGVTLDTGDPNTIPNTNANANAKVTGHASLYQRRVGSMSTALGSTMASMALLCGGLAGWPRMRSSGLSIWLQRARRSSSSTPLS